MKFLMDAKFDVEIPTVQGNKVLFKTKCQAIVFEIYKRKHE